MYSDQSARFLINDLPLDSYPSQELHDECRPLDWLNRPVKVQELKMRFAELHASLRRPTGLLVAQAVMQTIAMQNQRAPIS